MDSKICLILPWFGKLPPYWGGFIDSCIDNEHIDFLIITDCLYNDTYYSPNIRIINISWEKMQKTIYQAFKPLGFKNICISYPYKLCDYKPTLGFIFKDFITEYDFWGYIDCDLIFGNLMKFLRKIDIDKYDRIYRAGHLSIYRNTETINTLFLKNIPGCIKFSDVVGTSLIRNYDELGINNYFKVLGLPFYECSEDATFGIYTYEYRWKNQNNPMLGEIFVKNEDGSTVVYQESEDGKIICTEVNYIHFMTKKDIVIPQNQQRPYCILKKGVISFDYHNIKDYLKDSVSPPYINEQFKRLQIKQFRQASLKKIIREFRFNHLRAIPYLSGRVSSWFSYLNCVLRLK